MLYLIGLIGHGLCFVLSNVVLVLVLSREKLRGLGLGLALET